MSSPERPDQPEQHPAQGLPPEPTEPDETLLEETTMTVRRSPRYVNFMILGGLIGAITAFILTIAFPENDEFGQSQVFGFLLLAGVTAGVALGSLVALVIDRIIGRTTTTVVADRLGAHVPGAGESADAASDTPRSSDNTQ